MITSINQKILLIINAQVSINQDEQRFKKISMNQYNHGFIYWKSQKISIITAQTIASTTPPNNGCILIAHDTILIIVISNNNMNILNLILSVFKFILLVRLLINLTTKNSKTIHPIYNIMTPISSSLNPNVSSRNAVNSHNIKKTSTILSSIPPCVLTVIFIYSILISIYNWYFLQK